MTDSEQALLPITAFESATLAGFSALLDGVGRLDVLVVGAYDGGLLAARAAANGADVILTDADADRVNVARYRAQMSDTKIRVRGGSVTSWGPMTDAATVDLILAPWALAMEQDIVATLDGLSRLMRTDALMAVLLPHPAVTIEADGYFSSGVKQPPLHGWIEHAWYHRTLGEWSDLLDGAGLLLQQIHEVAPEHGSPPAHSGLVLIAGKQKW